MATGGAQTLVRKYASEDGVEVLTLGRAGLSELPVGLVCKARSISSWSGLWWLLTNYGEIRLVHAHLFPAFYIAVALFPFKKKVFTEHSTYNRRASNRFFKSFDRFIYSLYARIICISEEVKRVLIARGVPGSFLSVIHNGVDQREFPLSEFSPSIRLVTIGMAARFVNSKDQKALVRALALLPDDYELRFAGDGPNLAEAEDLAISLGVDHRVEFLGDYSGMSEFMRV